ncbi:MAG: hypothetical protein Q4G63_04290 [Bacteroidia bacterium]|nr:hypothetical protein [Bacteroidia bacterium]
MEKCKVLLIFLFIGLVISSCSKSEENYESKIMSTRAATATIITYPTVSEIASNYQVIASMEAAWNNTIYSANNGHRQEYGFFIYYDYSNNKIYPGTIVAGGSISGCTGYASISLGVATNNLQVCAFFHTHTPLNNCSSTYSRVVGPSGTDTQAYDGKLPGLLYDYVGTNGVLYGGHTVSAPKKLYTFGPTRKASISI